MKKAYKEINLSHKRTILLSNINKVIVKYQQMGYRLTLRQLYYQLVANDIIPNRVSEYQKLSSLLTDARMGGFVDWDVIEDRGRIPHMHPEFDNLKDLMDSAYNSFRLPRWKFQEHYIELWTEKDALTSVLKPITNKYHIRLVVNKGYTSTSAMYRASMRYKNKYADDKRLIILYLGDHDASGLDMDRDIQERMNTFNAPTTFERIGLTMEQIEEINPPPNPAKMTDTRANWYVKKFGKYSWEVDAIPPEKLNVIVEKAIVGYMDINAYEKVIEQENKLKEWLLEQVSDEDEFYEEVEDW